VYARGLAHGADGVAAARAVVTHATNRRDLAPAHLPVRATDDSIAWCNGDTGIALAALIAGDALADRRWLDAAREGFAALGREVGERAETRAPDLCLCHGLVGAADALLTAGRRFPALGDLCDLAADVGGTAIERYAMRGRRFPLGGLEGNPSLLLGEAGIGMFLLRLADAAVPSILAIGSRPEVSTVEP
jgi:lantibiotic modifying enzyme